MYKSILEDLNCMLNEYNKIEESFNLESKFKKGSKKVEKDLDIKKIKEKIQQLKDGKASLEELEEIVKEYKGKDKSPEESKESGKKP